MTFLGKGIGPRLKKEPDKGKELLSMSRFIREVWAGGVGVQRELVVAWHGGCSKKEESWRLGKDVTWCSQQEKEKTVIVGAHSYSAECRYT